jgi:hypothetical protein
MPLVTPLHTQAHKSQTLLITCAGRFSRVAAQVAGSTLQRTLAHCGATGDAASRDTLVEQASVVSPAALATTGLLCMTQEHNFIGSDIHILYALLVMRFNAFQQLCVTTLSLDCPQPKQASYLLPRQRHFSSHSRDIAHRAAATLYSTCASIQHAQSLQHSHLSC